jgi:seryl-tRNA synthetase
MLDIKYIRDNAELVEKKLKTRNPKHSLTELLEMDKERRELQSTLDVKKGERNSINKELPKSQDKKALIAKMKIISNEIKENEAREKELSEKIKYILAILPNIPHESVKISLNEEDAEVLRVVGEIPKFDFELKDHVDLGKINGLLDFERASKMSGARFALYTGKGARLERALINFMLDVQTEQNGYKEFITPFLVNSDSLFTTSNLPKFEEDLFKTQDNLYLVPTSEVTLVNIHRDEVLNREELPLK